MHAIVQSCSEVYWPDVLQMHTPRIIHDSKTVRLQAATHMDGLLEISRSFIESESLESARVCKNGSRVLM